MKYNQSNCQYCQEALYVFGILRNRVKIHTHPSEILVLVRQAIENDEYLVAENHAFCSYSLVQFLANMKKLLTKTANLLSHKEIFLPRTILNAPLEEHTFCCLHIPQARGHYDEQKKMEKKLKKKLNRKKSKKSSQQLPTSKAWGTQ